MTLTGSLVDVRPLRTSSLFRRLWIGQSLSIIGGQLTVVAVLSQVWQLTGSTAAVGTIGLAHAVPMVILGLGGGALADTVDRRVLVIWTTIGQIAAVTMLAVQALAGVGSLGLILLLVALQAASSSLGAPANRTFVARLLPGEQVSAGVALMHISFQVAMLAGPALAGVIIGLWDVGWCYVVDAVTFAVALYCVARLPAMRPLEMTSKPGIRAVGEGLRYIVRRPVLNGAFLTDVIATVMAMPIALFPAINDERFGGRPETLGLFISAIAAGGIAASIGSGRTTRSARPARAMLIAAAVWGIGLAGFGLAGPLWLALTCLALGGAADTISVISRGSIVQLATDDSHRGRVTSVENIVGVAGPDVGNFRAGLVAGVTSPTFALVSGGLLCVAGVAAVARNKPLRRYSP